MPFGSLVLQCSVDSVDNIVAIKAFVLCSALLLEFNDKALEVGGATRGQLKGTFWYPWISYVGLLRIRTKPGRGLDVLLND